MAFKNYQVRIKFTKDETGAVAYVLPYVDQIQDPQPATKDVIINGIRGDGCIRIKGGIKSQEITVRGQLVDADGYKDITALIAEMRSEVTTDIGVLRMEHYDGGWVTDWEYNVFRHTEIRFPKSLRVSSQKYEISFLVLNYS